MNNLWSKFAENLRKILEGSSWKIYRKFFPRSEWILICRLVTPHETLCRRHEPVLSRSACFVVFSFPLCVRVVRFSLLAFSSCFSLSRVCLSFSFLSPVVSAWFVVPRSRRRGRRRCAFPVLFLGLPILGASLSWRPRLAVSRPCALYPFSGRVVAAECFTASFFGSVPYSI